MTSIFLKNIKTKAIGYYEKNEARLSIVFFIAGFLIDVLTLSEIDDNFSLLQQLCYLIIIAGLLLWEVRHSEDKSFQSSALQKIWTYRNPIQHFLLGSLLSVYSLFYFKSSSFFQSFIFIGILFLLMVANEFQRVQSAGAWVKVSLWVLSLISFLSIITSLALGFIGYIPFLITLICIGILFYTIYRSLKNFPTTQNLKKQFYIPAISTVSVFILFYFLGFIPPIPLSAKYMGIYHNIEKKDGHYYLYHYNPKWKFWNHGDQTFYARPDDKIYLFTNIYSPANFSDQIFVRWTHYEDPLGWQDWDRIPIKISGGRADGFRGYTYKTKFAYGDWKVYLETSDGREIGRISFSVNELTEEQNTSLQMDIQ